MACGYSLGIALGMTLLYALALLVLLAPKSMPKPVVNLCVKSDSISSNYAYREDRIPDHSPQTRNVICHFDFETIHLPEFPEIETEYFLCRHVRINGLMGSSHGLILQYIEKELSPRKSYTRYLSKWMPQEI